MFCKSCNYPLWNINTRQCPECGAPFKPSEFQFALNSVQFKCPHCAQSYYGTGHDGHLVPPEFDCVSCGQFIRMDEMVLLPTEGVAEAQTRAEVNPWIERRATGVVRAWFATIGRAMTAPASLMQATPVEYPTASALWFALLTQAIFIACAGGLLMCPVLIFSRGTGAAAGAVGVTIASFLVALLGLLLYMVVWSAATHGLLRLTGPVDSPFGRTMQCICFSSGANSLCAIPCIGLYLSWLFGIWWVVSAILMVKTAHRTTGARAAFATLAFPVFALVLGVIGYATLIFAGTRTAFAPVGTTMVVTPTGTVIGHDPEALEDAATRVMTGLESHLADTGAWPAHAVELTNGNPLIHQHVCVMWDVTTSNQAAVVYGVALDDMTVMPDLQQRAFFTSCAAALPPGVIAHRVGDYVFTYHGINAAVMPDLWVFVQCPDPTLSQASPAYVTVGHADGYIDIFAASEFAGELEAQNQARAAAGLPPLPDPRTVGAAYPGP
jgi:predicted Zn finger-like uncharacterized protein